MKIYNERCAELFNNGGIFKVDRGTFYYKPGYIYHREDGPAVEWHDGTKTWRYNNKWIMQTHGVVTQDQVQEFLLRLL